MLSGSWGPTINEKTNGGRNGGRAGGYVDCCSGCFLNPILSKIMEHDILLGDKMNLTVRLSKQFPESSPCLPRQLGTGQRGRWQVLQWNSHKTVDLTSLSGLFCHLVFSSFLVIKSHL